MDNNDSNDSNDQNDCYIQNDCYDIINFHDQNDFKYTKTTNITMTLVMSFLKMFVIRSFSKILVMTVYHLCNSVLLMSKNDEVMEVID